MLSDSERLSVNPSYCILEITIIFILNYFYINNIFLANPMYMPKEVFPAMTGELIHRNKFPYDWQNKTQCKHCKSKGCFGTKRHMQPLAKYKDPTNCHFKWDNILPLHVSWVCAVVFYAATWAALPCTEQLLWLTF